MKHKLTILLLLATFFGNAAHTIGQVPSKNKAAKIENQISAIFDEMVALAEKLDYDGLNKGVDDKHKAGFIVNGRYFTDYQTLVDGLKSNIGGVKGQEIKIGDKKITLLSKKLALLTCTGAAQIQLEDGSGFDSRFCWSFLYEKSNGSWKVVYSHQSRAK